MLSMKRILAVLALLAIPAMTLAQSGVGGGGQSNASGGGVSAATKRLGNTYYLTGFGGLANGHNTTDAVTTNVSPIVTSATAHFQTNAIVGEDVYVLGNVGQSIVTGTVAQILSIDSDTQIHMTANATATTSVGILFFGSNDDASWTAIDAAASTGGGMCNMTIVVPAGMSRVTKAHMYNSLYNSNCIALDTTTGGVTLQGEGIKSSFIVVGPDYDYTNAWGNNSATYFQDIQFTGLTVQSASANGKNFSVSGNAGDAKNFAVAQMNNTTSMNPYSMNSNGAGCQKCFFDTVSAINLGIGSVVSSSFITAAGVAAGGFSASVLGTYGQTIGPGFDCTNGTFTGTQDKYYHPTSGTLFNFRVNNAACSAFLSQVDLTDSGGGTVGLGYSAGGTMTMFQSKLSGGTLGAIYSVGASGNPIFDDEGGNTLTCSGCTNPLQSFTVGTWTGPGENNFYTSCSGAVTAATTIGFRISGTSTTGAGVSSACTDTVIDAGAPMKSGGKLYGIIVTVTSGTSTGDVVTVLKNGSGTTFTCTITTSAGCRQVGVAPVAVAINDLLSVNDVTAAGSTISGIKITVIIAL